MKHNHYHYLTELPGPGTDGLGATIAKGSVAKTVRSRIVIIMEQLHET